MKHILKLTFSIITTIVAFVLFMSSLPPHSDIFFFPLVIILIGGLVISITIFVWSKKDRKTAFLNSLDISFGLSSLIFICGYLYPALQPIFFR